MSNRQVLLRWSIVLVVFLCGTLAFSKLTIKDNALDLLPDGAVRGDLLKLQQAGLVDRIFITLTVDPSAANAGESHQTILRMSVDRLDQALREQEEFRNVIARLPTSGNTDEYGMLWEYFPAIADERDIAEIRKLIAPDELDRLLRAGGVAVDAGRESGDLDRRTV